MMEQMVDPNIQLRAIQNQCYQTMDAVLFHQFLWHPFVLLDLYRAILLKCSWLTAQNIAKENQVPSQPHFDPIRLFFAVDFLVDSHHVAFHDAVALIERVFYRTKIYKSLRPPC